MPTATAEQITTVPLSGLKNYSEAKLRQLIKENRGKLEITFISSKDIIRQQGVKLSCIPLKAVLPDFLVLRNKMERDIKRLNDFREKIRLYLKTCHGQDVRGNECGALFITSNLNLTYCRERQCSSKRKA